MIYEDSDLDDEVLPKGAAVRGKLVLTVSIGIATAVVLILLAASKWH